MDDVNSNQVQVLDNEDNRKERQKVRKDDLEVSMDLQQAIKE